LVAVVKKIEILVVLKFLCYFACVLTKGDGGDGQLDCLLFLEKLGLRNLKAHALLGELGGVAPFLKP